MMKLKLKVRNLFLRALPFLIVLLSVASGTDGDSLSSDAIMD